MITTEIWRQFLKALICCQIYLTQRCMVSSADSVLSDTAATGEACTKTGLRVGNGGETLDASASPPRAIDPHSVLEPGSDFGPRYRIISLLGRGGMGEVHKAYDRELNRTVVLKVIRSEMTSQPNSMLRFKQELLLASKVSHKNILRIHDLGDVNGVKFISMAYIEGEDL